MTMFHLDTLATLVAATLTLLFGVSWSIPSPFEEIHHTGTCCGWFVVALALLVL
ncbi:hypothetical protein ACVXHB_25960 [Escherichia coli]